MKSLQESLFELNATQTMESLFDKDLFDKGVVLDTDAAYEYFASILLKSDFVKHNNYDSPKRSYTIDRGDATFRVTLMGTYHIAKQKL